MKFTAKARVIKIIDDMKIVLNCGKVDGIKENDRFNIYSNSSRKIVDPFTNECLGEFRAVKAKIEVTAVYDRMCVCQNAETVGSITELAVAVSGLYGKRRALNVEPTEITGGLEAEVDEPIRIGDYAEKVD